MTIAQKERQYSDKLRKRLNRKIIIGFFIGLPGTFLLFYLGACIGNAILK